MKLKIKEFREELQFTQKELAEKIGNVQRNVSNWENGTSEPDLDTIVKLADIFDITIDELFGRETPFLGHQQATGIEFSILKSVRQLTEAQKYALMQFLRELEN